MESTTNPEAKEATVFEFTCKMTYNSEHTAISTFPASSYREAVDLCKSDPNVRSVLVLGTRDLEPQAFLAW